MSGILLPGQDKKPAAGGGIELPKGFSRRRDEPEPNRYYDRSLTNDRGGDHVGDGSGGTIRDEHAWRAFVL